MTTKYVAYDGKEFDNSADCQNYEKHSLNANADEMFKAVKTLVANSAIANQNCAECPFCDICFYLFNELPPCEWNVEGILRL